MVSIPRQWLSFNHSVMMAMATSFMMTPFDNGIAVVASSFISALIFNMIMPSFDDKSVPLEAKMIISVSLGVVLGIIISFKTNFDPDMGSAVTRLGSPLFSIPLTIFIFYLGYFTEDKALSAAVYSLMTSVLLGQVFQSFVNVGLLTLVTVLSTYAIMKILIALNKGKKEKIFNVISILFGTMIGFMVQFYVTVKSYNIELNYMSYGAMFICIILFSLYITGNLPYGFDKILSLK